MTNRYTVYLWSHGRTMTLKVEADDVEGARSAALRGQLPAGQWTVVSVIGEGEARGMRDAP